jgi:hypothetical protein
VIPLGLIADVAEVAIAAWIDGVGLGTVVSIFQNVDSLTT